MAKVPDGIVGFVIGELPELADQLCADCFRAHVQLFLHGLALIWALAMYSAWRLSMDLLRIFGLELISRLLGWSAVNGLSACS